MRQDPKGRTWTRFGVVVGALLLVLVQLPGPQARAGLVTVTDVRVKEFPGKVQVSAIATGAFRHRLTEWSGKPRELVVVDLLGAQLGVPARELPYRNGLVKSVRVGQFNATTVRLVVEVAREVSYTLGEIPGAYALALVLATDPAPGSNGARQASGVREAAQREYRAMQAQQQARAPRYTLVFRDAKVSDVMAALARLAGVNIVVGSDAGRKQVTLRLLNVTLTEALDLILQPLKLSWYPVGRNYVVPDAENFLRYYPLRHARADRVAQQITRLLIKERAKMVIREEPGGVRVTEIEPPKEFADFDANANVVIVFASADKHLLISELVRRLDVPENDPTERRWYDVVHVPASAIVSKIAQLLQLPDVRMLEDSQGNRVLVIARRSQHADIARLLRDLDVPDPNPVEARWYVLRNAPVAVVASSLSKATEGRGVRIATDERTNRLLIAARRSDHTLISSLVRELDVEVRVAIATRVYPLRWLNVDPARAERPGEERDVGADIVRLLQEHLRPSTPTITFDYRNNALVVTGTEGDHERVAGLLAQIDTPVPQVIIEATVLDVNLDRFRDLGISWQWSPFGFQEEPTSPGQILFSPITRQPINFSAVIGALVSEGRARLLANPRVSTRDGQPAIIDVTEQVPFVAGVSPQGVPIIQFVSAGVTLNITPKINPDGMISTRILATVGAVRGAGQNVTVSQRRALTSLTVREGTPIVLAGLIRNEDRTQTVKVPLLGDIPILGWLFRREERTRTNSEVVFVLTPRVLPRVSEQR